MIFRDTLSRTVTPFEVFRSMAPFWALNEEYIAQRVTEPCEFIVINYDHLQRRLWENGIDPTVFWNVRRLTPQVFLPREKNDSLVKTARELDEAVWVVKRDFGVLEEDGIQDRAAYVLRHTIEMMLSVSSTNRQMKSPAGKNIRKIVLKAGDIPYFAKASRMKGKSGLIPQSLRELTVTYAVPGLDSRELFWSFGYFHEPDSQGTATLILGFVGDDDVERTYSLNADILL
jgi:hypothetical protein